MCSTPFSFFQRIVTCTASSLIEAVFGPLERLFKELFELLVTGAAPQSAGRRSLFGRPQGGTWETVWQATWLGSGEPWMLGLALTMLFVGLYIRSTLSILGVGQMSKQRRNGRLGKGILMLVFWWPAAVLWLYIIEFLSVVTAPSAGAYDAMFASLYSPSAGDISTLALSGGVGFGALAAIPVALAGFGVLVLYVLGEVQDLLVIMYVWFMPILIALWAWGVPFLSKKAQEYGSLFIPISFLPVPLALFTRVFVVAVSNNFVTDIQALRVIFAPLIYVTIAILIAWKFLSEGAPMATKALTVGAGLTLAGGLYKAGAGRLAVAAAARGDLSRGVTRGVLGSRHGPESTIQGTARQNGKTGQSGSNSSSSGRQTSLSTFSSGGNR